MVQERLPATGSVGPRSSCPQCKPEQLFQPVSVLWWIRGEVAAMATNWQPLGSGVRTR